MPAVLIETGFIANFSECKRLIDTKFQNNIAVAIFNGLNLFFAEVDPAFQPYQYKYY